MSVARGGPTGSEALFPATEEASGPLDTDAADVLAEEVSVETIPYEAIVARYSRAALGIKRAIDVGRHRVDARSLRQRDRQVGRAEKQSVDAGRGRDGGEIVEAGAGLDHGEGHGVYVGFCKIDLLVSESGQHGSPMRPPAALAKRGIFGRGHEGSGVGHCVDHRRDDAFGAEIERAACGGEISKRHPRYRRASALAYGGDRLHGLGHAPEAVLHVDGDGALYG